MKQKVLMGAVAALSIATLALTGCATGDAPAEKDGEPQVGGTLKVLATGDLDRYDPQIAAYVPTTGMMHTFSRSLLSYAPNDDQEERIKVRADLLEEVPTPSEDGLTYEVKLREGAMWDAADGPRQIVAEDLSRGFERQCNPYMGAALGGYFPELIKGMADYCAGFADVAPEVGPMKEYIESNDIAGIEVTGELTATFHLTQPAADFVSMISLNVADPAPIEALDALPDSPEYRANFVASGPYRIADHVQDSKLVLERNPAWDPESDPLRNAYVDGIEMTMGLTADAAFQQLQAGSADMLFDISPSPAILSQLTAQNDTKLTLSTNGGLDQFMWFNTMSDNNDGLLKDVKVRQALQYAVDKAAVVQVMGGEEFAGATSGIFAPGILGFEEGWDPYETEGSKGDPEKAKQLLAEAGHPDGFTLKMPYRNSGVNPDIAQTLKSSFEEAGITLELEPVQPTDYYANVLTNRERTAKGDWDVALVGWNPTWQGGAARSVFQPQFMFTGTPQVYNYVDYNSDKANEFAAQALAAPTEEETGRLWHEADKAVMEDAPIVSISYKKVPSYRSARVGNFQVYAQTQNGDFTNVWIKQ